MSVNYWKLSSADEGKGVLAFAAHNQSHKAVRYEHDNSHITFRKRKMYAMLYYKKQLGLNEEVRLRMSFVCIGLPNRP